MSLQEPSWSPTSSCHYMSLPDPYFIMSLHPSWSHISSCHYRSLLDPIFHHIITGAFLIPYFIMSLQEPSWIPYFFMPLQEPFWSPTSSCHYRSLPDPILHHVGPLWHPASLHGVRCRPIHATGTNRRSQENVAVLPRSGIDIISPCRFRNFPLLAKFMAPHGAYLRPTGPRWAPCGPRETLLSVSSYMSEKCSQQRPTLVEYTQQTPKMGCLWWVQRYFV